jgi:hypothetical protein
VADQFNILDRPARNPLLPAGAIAQTFPRSNAVISDGAVLLSGRLSLVAIALDAGELVSSITFLSRTTAAIAPTNQWFALLNNAASPVLLGQTADDTSTAWGANTLKTLNMSTPYRTTYSGLHYLGIMVAAGTVPSMAVVNVSSGTFGAIAPVMAGTSTTGLTTPASFTSPALAPTGTTVVPYAYVS